MAVKIGINGFGRIGRLVLRVCAENPEMEAATGCHLPNPRGAKIGARIPPRIAMILSLLSSTNPIPLPVFPILERIHMITVARKRMVPALMMKPFSLSQT